MNRRSTSVAKTQKRVLANACQVLESIVGTDVRSSIKDVKQTETEIVFFYTGDINEEELERFSRRTQASWQMITQPGVGRCIQINISYKELSHGFGGGLGFLKTLLLFLLVICILFISAYWTSPPELLPFLFDSN